MKLSKQVCSLEQAKRLRELGINEPSICKYYESSVGVILIYTIEGEGYLDNEWFAFTVAELGVMLPLGVDVKNSRSISNFRSGKNSNIGKYGITGNYSVGSDYANVVEISESGYDVYQAWKCFDGETEAIARANCLIYLLENNLITAEQCNKALTDAR